MARTHKGKYSERKHYGVRINPALIKQVRILAAQRETQSNILVEEALDDLLKKYKRKKRQG